MSLRSSSIPPVPRPLSLAALALLVLADAACRSDARGEDDDADEASEDVAETRAERAAPAEAGWRHDFELAGRTLATVGRAPFLVLEPGFQLVLADEDGEEELVITVLDETKVVGGVETRVVEERESEDGELAEISRNYLAIDPETLDVYYFGEDVDVYRHGAVVSHPGGWHAGEGGARAGLMVPGAPSVGERYYQEYAPGEALDRAEVVSLAHTLATPAGTFAACLRTEETSGLDPREREFKTYAPGIGLIQDEELLLVRYGMAARR